MTVERMSSYNNKEGNGSKRRRDTRRKLPLLENEGRRTYFDRKTRKTIWLYENMITGALRHPVTGEPVEPPWPQNSMYEFFYLMGLP
jgi:hypothetical protein